MYHRAGCHAVSASSFGRNKSLGFCLAFEYLCCIVAVWLVYRALLAWGGSRKHVCFQTWRQWVQLKRGKKTCLRQALQHWQARLLAASLSFWLHYTRHKQVRVYVQ